ncbi:MAG: DUF1592 domain-containing protein [Luteolibacter sp.]
MWVRLLSITAGAMAGFAAGWLCAPWIDRSTPSPAASRSIVEGAGPLLAPDPSLDYGEKILPILESHCFDCHADGITKGGIEFDSYDSIDALLSDHDLWIQVREQMSFQLMPPPDEPLLPEMDREMLISWIDEQVLWVDPHNPDPGVVTMRRLNRNEYARTIHDLLGVEVDVGSLLPPDDTGYGFDNIGDVLTFSAAHIERYHMAAVSVLDQALALGEMPQPLENQDIHEWAADVLSRFLLRAFRRPPDVSEVERYLGVVDAAIERGESAEIGLRDAFERVLVSPWFLFRGELPDASNSGMAGGKRLIDEFALASRLSYFLWGSMPDDRLLELAMRGDLRKSLDAEIERMLQSPKIESLASDFAGQWLQLRDLPLLSPDRKRFPEFDASLAADMKRETEELFNLVLRENLPVDTLISADFTLINQRLAAHYGIHGVEGDHFRRVSLGDLPRRGILGHASILTLTSYPTRTSPVLRGRYILDTILNTPPPPPPQNIPPLESVNADAGAASLRAELERHRADPNCSACHALIDPLGFGLESFDALGRVRMGGSLDSIDTSGVLTDGTRFAGTSELLQILHDRYGRQFLDSMVQRMLTYALGRGLTLQDRTAISHITAHVQEHELRMIPLIHAIIHSVPFQYHRTP